MLRWWRTMLLRRRCVGRLPSQAFTYGRFGWRFRGQAANLAVVEEVTKAIRIPVELGGGIRDMAGIEAVFAAGVQWAILGTVAIEQPEFVAEAVRVYGDRILVGIDARDGMVAVRAG